jgi:hypothetical protein
MAPTKFILANRRDRMTKKGIVRTIKERWKTEGVALRPAVLALGTPTRSRAASAVMGR